MKNLHISVEVIWYTLRGFGALLCKSPVLRLLSSRLEPLAAKCLSSIYAMLAPFRVRAPSIIEMKKADTIQYLLYLVHPQGLEPWTP